MRISAEDITAEDAVALSSLPKNIYTLWFYNFAKNTDLSNGSISRLVDYDVDNLRFEKGSEAAFNTKFFAAVAKMKNLNSITFDNSEQSFGDSDLAELAASKTLRKIHLARDRLYPNLTDDGMKKLAAAIPKCTIVWPGGTIWATDTTGFVTPKAGETVDLLPLIDPAERARQGIWVKNNNSLVSSIGPYNSIDLPVLAGKAYRIEALAEKLVGDDAMSVGFLAEDSEARVIFEGFRSSTESAGKPLSGIQHIDGKSLDKQTSPYDKPVFVPGRPTRIVIEVRPGRIQVKCDDAVVADWQGDPASLFDWSRNNYGVPPKRLYVGTNEASYRFSKLTYTDLPVK